jgi:hypothetical protein
MTEDEWDAKKEAEKQADIARLKALPALISAKEGQIDALQSRIDELLEDPRGNRKELDVLYNQMDVLDAELATLQAEFNALCKKYPSIDPYEPEVNPTNPGEKDPENKNPGNNGTGTGSIGGNGIDGARPFGEDGNTPVVPPVGEEEELEIEG